MSSVNLGYIILIIGLFVFNLYRIYSMWQRDRRDTVFYAYVFSTFAAFMILFTVFLTLVDAPWNAPEDRTLDQRISDIQTSLNEVAEISQEVQQLGQQAIEAEQRAADAIALSNLTEEEVAALDRRLNRDQTARDLFFVILGGFVGVAFDRFARWIENKYVNEPSLATGADK